MRWFLNFFTKDIWRKLLALVLTGCVYFSISELQKEKQPLEVPVTVSAVSGFFIPKEKRELKVILTLQGDPARINKISAKELRGTVKAQNEDQVIRLTEDNFGSVSGIKIAEIKPREINTGAKRLVSRKVNVVYANGVETGTPDVGFEKEKVTFEPAEVSITGPAEEVQKLTKIKLAAPVNIRGAHTFTENYKLENPDPDLFEISPASVTVQVNIRKKAEISREFAKVPIHLLFSHLSLERALKVENVFPLSATVTLQGSKKAVDEATSANIVLFADLTPASFEEPGPHPVVVSGYLQGIPEGSDIRIKDISEKQVRVLIRAPEQKKAAEK